MITEIFSPFYNFGREHLDLSTSDISKGIDNHAAASINGRTIEIDFGDHKVYGRAGLGHTKHASKWVNQFNSKSHIC
jgi:hypothetical protein